MFRKGNRGFGDDRMNVRNTRSYLDSEALVDKVIFWAFYIIFWVGLFGGCLCFIHFVPKLFGA